MTIGGLAGLIAAIAFAVLVAFICVNLSKLSQIMSDVQDTVTRLNTTIDVVTKDVDNLSIEVEGLLNKANTLVDDVNGKLEKTDPLFTAIGDLGVTVSDLNDSTKNMTVNLIDSIGSKSKRRKTSTIERLVRSGREVAQTRAKQPPKPTEVKPEVKVKAEEASIAVPVQAVAEAKVEIPRPKGPSPEETSRLAAYRPKETSHTAGEIRLK